MKPNESGIFFVRFLIRPNLLIRTYILISTLGLIRNISSRTASLGGRLDNALDCHAGGPGFDYRRGLSSFFYEVLRIMCKMRWKLKQCLSFLAHHAYGVTLREAANMIR